MRVQVSVVLRNFEDKVLPYGVWRVQAERGRQTAKALAHNICVDSAALVIRFDVFPGFAPTFSFNINQHPLSPTRNLQSFDQSCLESRTAKCLLCQNRVCISVWGVVWCFLRLEYLPQGLTAHRVECDFEVYERDKKLHNCCELRNDKDLIDGASAGCNTVLLIIFFNRIIANGLPGWMILVKMYLIDLYKFKMERESELNGESLLLRGLNAIVGCPCRFFALGRVQS